MTVIFVCTGNTCRSPMAAGIFNKLAAQAGLTVEAASCGLSAFVPTLATPEAVQAAAVYGADISGHKATQVSEALMCSADFVYCMTQGHLDVLKLMFPPYASRMRMLASGDIADPFGGGPDIYATAAKQIAAAVERLIARLAKNTP